VKKSQKNLRTIGKQIFLTVSREGRNRGHTKIKKRKQPTMARRDKWEGILNIAPRKRKDVN